MLLVGLAEVALFGNRGNGQPGVVELQSLLQPPEIVVTALHLSAQAGNLYNVYIVKLLKYSTLLPFETCYLYL
jgi:hypothetical protein